MRIRTGGPNTSWGVCAYAAAGELGDSSCARKDTEKESVIIVVGLIESEELFDVEEAISL